MRGLGGVLVRLGLVLPPVGIVLQLAGQITVGRMLTLLVAAVCLFGIGRIIEGYSQ